MNTKMKLITGPAIEPVTLADLEMHLRLQSNDIASDLASTQSIAPADHAIAAAYTLIGAGIEVLNYQTVVYLVSGANAAGGTVDVKLQESDDDITYEDVTGGAFAQVTTANDNATYEKAYTGIKQYIRAVATVAVDACAFGVDIVTVSPLSVEDDYLTSLIVSARWTIERLSGRRLINQTWALALDCFPPENFIKLPMAPLATVTTVNYYDTDDAETTYSSDNYYVDTYQDPGQIMLNYGQSWPSYTPRPANAAIINYVVGYGDAAADVPDVYKQAIMILAAELYENREASDVKRFEELPWKIKRLIGFERIWKV